MALLVGCVDLTPPWQRAANRDAGPAAGSGGLLVRVDTSGAGGSTGDGGWIEGWPTADVPLTGVTDGAGFGVEGGATDALDAVISAVDAPRLDVALGAEAGNVTDGSPTTADSGRADVALDVPMGGSGGMGGSFLDASAEGTGGRGSGGTGGRDASDGGATDGRDAGTGGRGTGGSGTGGSGTGGSGTGGSGTGGSGTGGSGTGGSGGNLCSGYQGRDAGSELTEGLLAYYRCEAAAGTSGTLLPDDSPSQANPGTLHTGAGGAAGYSFAAGKVFDALYLVAAQQGYVTLPAGLLANACEATIATWVWVNGNTNWQRIFDFGRDTNVYMFLTPRNGGSNVLRFAITIGGNQVEQRLEGSEPLPTGSWNHVAVVLGPNGGFLYVNGAQVASDPALTLRPADLGNLPNLYIGRSQFAADPYLDGNIDSFRIYDRALSADEINAAYLYTGV
jgi:hypothetical protein